MKRGRSNAVLNRRCKNPRSLSGRSTSMPLVARGAGSGIGTEWYKVMYVNLPIYVMYKVGTDASYIHPKFYP